MIEKFKAGVVPAIVGAVLTVIVGFGWGGWYTGGGAQSAANTAAKVAVTEALVPICVVQAQADPEAETKLAALGEASSYQRTKMVTDAGWATTPAAERPNDAVAKECATALLALATK